MVSIGDIVKLNVHPSWLPKSKGLLLVVDIGRSSNSRRLLCKVIDASGTIKSYYMRHLIKL